MSGAVIAPDPDPSLSDVSPHPSRGVLGGGAQGGS